MGFPNERSPIERCSRIRYDGVVIDARPRLLLASRSPRRRDLLATYGIEHDVVDSGVDDSELTYHGPDPAAWARALAYLKARAGAAHAKPGQIVLAADTICVLGDEVIGQPRDRDDAERILRSFVGTTHDVLTGVALVPADRSWRDIFVDRAAVTWGGIPDDEIERYLDSGAWFGKAGAYNLEERLRAGWAITYEGDPTSIVGLPMEALLPRLDRLHAAEPAA